MLDVTKLNEGLEKLTGLDFEAAEKAERDAGNYSPVVTASPRFIIRLAASALGVVPPEIQALPIKQYAKIVNETTRFLYGTLEEEAEPTN